MRLKNSFSLLLLAFCLFSTAFAVKSAEDDEFEDEGLVEETEQPIELDEDGPNEVIFGFCWGLIDFWELQNWDKRV